MSSKYVVLLVDRDHLSAKLTRFVLEEAGYTVLEAPNGDKTLKLARTHRIDVVVLETRLDDIDGNELCRLLKEAYFAHRFVPVIMLTANSSLSDRVGGLLIGADDYIVKPYDPSELLARIESKMRLFERHFTPILEEDDPHSVTMRFHFPPAVRVACEQYLWYFVEFLRDVGVEAKAQLREEAKEVLFSVKPDNKDQALDQIKEALEIYLGLPANRSTSIVTPETSIEVQKLSAQLSLLQSQFYLAQAALGAQAQAIKHRDKTIEHQQTLIQQHLTSGRLLVQALEQKEDDAEPVVPGGLVKVKKWSWEAIEVDLPELFRMLKERFGSK